MRFGAAATVLVVAVAAAQLANGSVDAVREFGLYQIRLDGTGRTQLLSPDTDVVDIVAVSRDRTRILMHRLPSFDLYSASIDGSNLRLVASRQAVNGYLGAASWSPSGARVAFEVSNDQRADIWVANSDGSSLRRLVRRAVEPSWSPTGRRIAYIGSYFGHDPAGAITVGHSMGPLRPRQLGPIEFGDRTGTNPDNWMLRWSPHGSLLAYTVLRLKGEPRARERVAIVRANGPLRRSVHPIRAGRFRAWSPTGKRIVYSEGKSKRLILARPDGSHRRLLTTGLGPVEWSPDGRWIAFVDDVGRRCYQIFLVRPDGSGRRQLTNEACSARFNIFWTPDSRRVDYLLTVYDP
jgi:Tol biopolymer transport system component